MRENRNMRQCRIPFYLSGPGQRSGQPWCKPCLLSGFFPGANCDSRSFKVSVAANIYEKLGFLVTPNSTESRHDIIQAVTFVVFLEGVVEFCKGIQAAAPVDSYVEPEPWAMPGYDSDVIMAAGSFCTGFFH